MMRSLLVLALVVVSRVEATRYNNGLKYERRRLANETISVYTNSSTITTTTTTSSTSSSNSLTTPSSANSTTSTPLPGSGSTKYSNETSDIGTCVGLVTYWGSVPPTVYSTVTEGFDVTVTATNASVTVGETLITPPPACESTIMPLLGSFQPLATIAISSKLPPATSSHLSHTESHTESAASSHTSDSDESKTTPGSPWQPDVATTTKAPGVPPKNPQPDAPPPEEQSAEAPESFTVIASTIYATAPYTSTVIVTKKTPVVVVSATSSPPVFQQPVGPNQNNNPTGGNPTSPAGGNPVAPSNRPANDNPPPPSSGPKGDNPPAPSPGPGAAPGSGPSNTTPGIGNIILSLINTVGYVPAATAAPKTTIANVPVAFLPSTVLIGNSAIPIPQSSETIATVAGQVFTVRPSEIAASGTIVGIVPAGAVQMQPTPSAELTIVPGVIAHVQGSTVVIEGTTYRIGFGATPTTITVDGVPVGIGPAGVILPSTTVAANAVTDAPMVVESAGGITFSIDQSEVVIEGTTYRIGSGAPTITTEIDGQTLSIGPGGVGLKTTTLKPTVATGSPASGGAATTSSGLVQGSSATRLFAKRIGMKEMLGWMLMAVGGAWLFL